VDTYISQQKNQLLVSLENQVGYSQLVAVIVGDKGVGKSFLLDHLQLKTKNKATIARIDASLAMNEQQLDQAISLQLGLSWEGTPLSLEQRIRDELDQKVFIAIDDAHLLSEDCLNYLLKLNQNQLSFPESVLFIMLVGKESLPAIIEKTQVFSLNHEMCVVLRVEPIAKNETQAMVASLGNCDFNHVESLFDEKKLHYFWQLSKGNPAELDYHISRWLQENNPIKQVELSSQASASLGKSILYGLLVVVLSSVLVYQDEINQWISQEAHKNIKQQKQDTLAVKSSRQSDATYAKKSTSQPMDQSALNDPTQDAQSQLALNSETKDNEPLAENIIVSDQPIDNSQKATSETKQDVKTEPKTQLNDSHIGGSAKANNKEPKSVEEKVTKFQLNTDENWLLAQSAESFSLQWVGLSQQQSAQQFIVAHQLSGQMKIYRRITKGKTLYLVVSGSFATRASASEAIKGYKQRGITTAPWVKSIAAIQSEIKAFQSAQR